jgi:hypothetical protein
MEDRKKWKAARAQKQYGQSYDSLCSDRKHIIDQLYLVEKMIEDEKNNPKGCR